MAATITCEVSSDVSSPKPEHLTDYLWAQRIASGEKSARISFSQMYGERMLQTVYIWCKPFCGSECRLRRIGISRLFDNFATQNCDQILDAYEFLLGQLVNNVVGRYRGGCSLNSFLHHILHPDGSLFNNYRISYIQARKGKVVLPVWSGKLSVSDQKLLKEMLEGRDSVSLQAKFQLLPEEFEAAVVRLRETAKEAGWSKYWRYFSSIYGRETPLPTPRDSASDEESPASDIADPAAFIEDAVISAGDLERALCSLPTEKRAVIRLLYYEGYTTSEVAVALGKSTLEIRSIEAVVLRELRRHFKNS